MSFEAEDEVPRLTRDKWYELNDEMREMVSFWWNSGDNFERYVIRPLVPYLTREQLIDWEEDITNRIWPSAEDSFADQVMGLLERYVHEDDWDAESFEASNRMRGTDFSLSDDIDEWPMRKYSEKRGKEEVLDMIEQIRERMEFFKGEYMVAKRLKDKGAMIAAIRNFKALEGAHQALRWSLGEKGVEHPLY